PRRRDALRWPRSEAYASTRPPAAPRIGYPRSPLAMLNHRAARVLMIAAFGLSLCFLTYALAAAPSRIASRLGMRGLQRRRAIEGNAGWALIEPLVRWLGVRVGGVVGDDAYQALDDQIALAGDYLGLTPEEYVSLSIVSSLGMGAAAALAALVLGNNVLLF